MPKYFRAYDGEKYWYSDEYLSFIYDYKYVSLKEAPFDIDDLEEFTGKIDSNKVKIYVNDIIVNEFDDPNKLYQVIWSTKFCGFRKVPLGKHLPESSIDEMFMTVKGTIHSY